MKFYLLLLSIILFIGCGENRKSDQKERPSQVLLSTDVHHAGALMNFMHKGDLSAKVDLDSLQPKHLYALGALENLKGEILVMNGNVMTSRVNEGSMAVDKSMDHKAALLVYSHVKKWQEVSKTESFTNGSELEKWILEKAKNHGIDTEKPFPFLLKGKAEKLSWHVIDWPEGDTEHTHEKHVSSGLNRNLENADVSVLGFYSKNHKGVFTHHSSNVHMHMSSIEENLAGHVDNLNPGDEMTLLLPVSEK
ncbi:acetolactate decarboxylase [Halocola ammonii]